MSYKNIYVKLIYKLRDLNLFDIFEDVCLKYIWLILSLS